jgi:arylsulfatase A-like enzyme
MALPSSEVTIAKALRDDYNYSTIMIGKWHLGENAKPTFHGFDQSLGFNLISRYLPDGSPEAVDYHLPDLLDKLIWANVPYHVSRNGEKKRFAPKGYLTDYFAKEAAAAITVNKENPFFLYLSLSAPHTPLQALKSDYDQLGHIDDELTRVYAAMIVALDRAVGVVLESLKSNGLSDDTIVIFTNDNGAPSE